jgi:pimeloyl-ACP methyl ester carboxylesterase
MFEKAKTLFPGGVDSPVRAFAAVGGSPHFIARAAGARMRLLTLLALLLPLMAACGSAPQNENPPQDEAPHTSRTSYVVEREGVTTEVIGEGSGPLVILLSSLGRDVLEFDPLAERIAAAGFRVVRPQPRGFGKSVGPMEGLTLHDFAKDVAAVIERDGGGTAIMVGHAYGHFVAKMTAVDFPHLVRGVALVAASQKAISEEVRRWNAIGSDPTRPIEERRKYIQMVFFAPGNDPTPYLTGFSPEVRRMQDAARIGTPQAEYWAAGTAPLLDLQAAHDPYRPRSTVDELVNEFGPERVTVVVIPDSSHAVPIEQPAAVADAIVAWARKLP